MIAFLKALFAFISSSPELMKLVINLKASIEKEAVNRKVTDDLKIVNKAFESGDAKMLNDLFANRVPDPKTKEI